MKIKIPLWLIALALLLATNARADAAAYAQILKERDQVLSQILAAREAYKASGLSDEEALFSAQLALWTFRRDTAATKDEKTRQQQLIVTAYEKRLKRIQNNVDIGLATNVDFLLAKDRSLEAQQMLEKLRME